MPDIPDANAVSEAARTMGRKGGAARAKKLSRKRRVEIARKAVMSMTPERRRAVARKAQLASVKARRRKKKEKAA
jgi:hypothetical protein